MTELHELADIIAGYAIVSMHEAYMTAEAIIAAGYRKGREAPHS